MRSKDRSHDRLPPSVPLFRETIAAPAYRHLSFGARALLTALKARCVKNNGHVYLSQRDVGREIGHENRSDIANWYRELQHYGFIVQTEAGYSASTARGGRRIGASPICRRGRATMNWPTRRRISFDGTVPSSSGMLRRQGAGNRANGPRSKNRIPDYTSVPPLRPSGTDLQSISRLATSVVGTAARRQPSARRA